MARTLERGMHGSDVKRLQRYLTRAGHRTRADGEFGRRTARALKATERELDWSTAAAVAAAASSMWTCEKTPPPSPMIGNRRLRIGAAICASGARLIAVPGP